MKTFQLTHLLWIALIIATFSACDDNDNENSRKTVTIDFEDIQLPNTGYTDSLIYKKSGIDFYNKFTNWGTSTSWEGFSYSKLTDRTTPGLVNQYSVYAIGGAANSKIFAIAYPGFNQPTYFQFEGQKMYILKSVMVNNSTYAALSIKDGDNWAKKFEANDWYKVIFTGYNVAGEKETSVEYYLADFRNNKSYICDQWTEVKLESLGKVNKVEITFDSSDKKEYINTPTYVCLDNLIYYIEDK